MAGLVLSDRQRLDWLRLIRTEGVGPRSFRGLLNRFGGAADALAALPDLAARAGRRLVAFPASEAEREFEATLRLGARFVALGEAGYPVPLREIDSAPPLVAVLGQTSVLALPGVAVVGSRNASAMGLKFTARLARDLGEAGFGVVSGLARGIDTAAHEASLPTGTVAVLAGGLDNIYPHQNEPLLRRLCETGCALTEMPLGWAPRGRDFPRRNRIVSGLSYGTVVVEAARRSGSLITARFANEQGRIVFAVPGSPLDPRAEGCNDLLREGAVLCADATHVTEALAPLLRDPGATMTSPGAIREEPGRDVAALWDELDWLGGGEAAAMSWPAADELSERPAAPADLRARVIDLIGNAAVPLDDLIRASGAPAREIGALVLELEVEGRLQRYADGSLALRL